MSGGWEFVEAAYAIAYGTLALYGALQLLHARHVFALAPVAKDKK